MPADSKPSSFEAVFAAFAVVATFILGYGYWKLATRQAEQDAKIEQQAQERERASFQLQRESEDRRTADELEGQVISLVWQHLSRLGESGRQSATSERMVAVAAEFLSSKGRPGLLQMAQKLRDQGSAVARSEPRATAREPGAAENASTRWLALLATLPGDDLKDAEGVANEKLRAAKDLGMMPVVSVYKTRIKGRYVVALGKPVERSAALALAAEARRRKLSADAFAEAVGGWELTGIAPFPNAVRSASVE